MESLSITHQIRNPIYKADHKNLLTKQQVLVHEAILEVIKGLPGAVRAFVNSVTVNNDSGLEVFVVIFNLEGTYQSCDPANETWRHPARASVDFIREDMNKEKIVQVMHKAINTTLKERHRLTELHAQELERLIREM